MMKKIFYAGLMLATLVLPDAAQAQGANNSQHDMSTMKATPGADKAYMDSMAKMGSDMNAAMTGDADIDFAIMMVAHHQGAIDMAKVQLDYGRDPDLRKLSEAIVSAQESEVAFMKGWLAKRPGPAVTSKPAQHTSAGMAYMAVMERMNKDMNAAMTGDPDRDFATMMIPHHQGAIDMAKIQIEYGKDAELRKLSDAIIKAQESEIAFMKDWLARP